LSLVKIGSSVTYVLLWSRKETDNASNEFEYTIVTMSAPSLKGNLGRRKIIHFVVIMKKAKYRADPKSSMTKISEEVPHGNSRLSLGSAVSYG